MWAELGFCEKRKTKLMEYSICASIQKSVYVNKCGQPKTSKYIKRKVVNLN